MVLGVCRRALADPAEVEDAFQATFLVLVRRAGSVRVGDSLGRWLYGVSRRVAAKARARSHRARIRTTKAFVAKEQVPWPQYLDSHPVLSRPGPADRLLATVEAYLIIDWDRHMWKTVAHDFSESWGISDLPSVFLIDTEGKLYSTEAEGQLKTLIPRLLETTRTLSSGR
jgi:DNA-directed RNA polymerase specialized sigma24 family protein